MKSARKLIAMLLALIMVLSLVACGAKEEAAETTAEAETTTTETESADTTAAEGDKVKIGFICWGYSDPESKTYVRLMDYAGEACGFEPVYATYTDNEDIINQAETLIQGGCKGIITLATSAPLLDLCAENGVYVAQWASGILDEDLKAYHDANEYWAGYTLADNDTCTQQFVDILYEKGCRNLLVVSANVGSPIHDYRCAGIQKALATYPDMTLVQEYRDSDLLNKAADSVTNYLNMYPEIDCILSTVGSSDGVADSIVQALTNTGKAGDIVFVTYDLHDNAEIDMQDGIISAYAAETFSDPVWLSIVMLNKINGWGADLPAELSTYLTIADSPEGLQDFYNYVCGEGVQPYTAEEYQSVLYTNNPDVTIEDIQALMNQAASMETLKAKQGG